MRWTSVFCILMLCAILSSTYGEKMRKKRSLSFLKRLLISHLRGNVQRKCSQESAYPKASRGYEIFIIPEPQNLALETQSEIRRPLHVNVDSNFLNSMRQFLASDTTSELLRGLLNTIQSWNSTFQEVNSVNNNYNQVCTEQEIEYVSEDTFKGTQKSVPVAESTIRPIFNYEMIHERPKMSSSVPSVVQLVSPIIPMPRKYSYEQVKGDRVEKFTLDDNSDVIVTETRNTIPRPAHIDDRIKEIIYSVPIPVSSSKLDSNIDKANLKQAVNLPSQGFASLYKVNNDDRYQPLITEPVISRNFYKQVNYIKPDQLTVVNLKNVQSLTNTESEKKELHSIDPQKDTTEKQPDLISRKDPKNYVYVRPKLHEPKVSNKDVIGFNENVQTRFAYKQETEHGTYTYGDTSVVASGQQDANTSANDNISSYTGKPIIVNPVGNPFKVVNMYSLRGDIPESS